MKLTVLGNILDKDQLKAAITNNCHTIIIAGAGSGKSLTMVGKIKYLVLYKHIPLESILCITFTNNAALSLQKKIEKELNQKYKVYTFHKLSLEILKNHQKNYNIAPPNLLEFIIDEIFYSIKSPYLEKLFATKNYLETKQFLQFKNLISKFIRLYITNFKNIKSFSSLIKKSKKQEKPLLLIIKKIYEIYELEKRSSNLIDFDDMIFLATNSIKEKGSPTIYRYIIIDEYQDTSLLRNNLVKAIKEQTNSLITVVGDDFQSIYRFTGCDIYIFLKFIKYFKPVKKLYIKNTYRNSQELIKIAGNFIMKNPNQIKKNLKSSQSLTKPLVICYYKNIKDDFYKLLKIINSNNIMILGRNNKDIYSLISSKLKLIEDKIIFPNKTIYYKTIHKAKGLEEENVIIINLTNDIDSLPSKIKEEKILKYVLKNYDVYPYEEERRLFYVALTRTKNYCYLFVSKNNPSIFVTELIKNYKKYISFIDL